MLFEYKKIKSLNDTEKAVYTYILNHIDDDLDGFLAMSVREVADEAYTSPAAVVRFCRKMDCDGFDDFKIKLKEYIKEKSVLNNDEEYLQILKSLEYVHNTEFKIKKDEFVHMVDECAQIVFFGVGNNAAIARYGARYFSNFNYYATFIDDPFYPVIVNGSKLLLIVISETGETMELLEKIEEYKNANTRIVLITNHPESTLAGYSELVFGYTVSEHYLIHTYNITTAVPVIYLIETLGRELGRISTMNTVNSTEK